MLKFKEEKTNTSEYKIMHIRKTDVRDIKAVTKIYEQAREFMHASGNKNQWIGRPNKEDVLSDIENGNGYVVESDEKEIVGVFYLSTEADPTYTIIEGGAWINDTPYAIIHRIAVKYHGQGIADFIYNHAYNIRQNVRIDTHRDNIPMQKSLQKNGFKYCGIIYLESGDERLAFQKV